MAFSSKTGVSSQRYEESQRILDRIVLERPLPSDAEANIRWGDSSDFDLVSGSGNQVPTQPTITIIIPPDPECDPDDQQVIDWGCASLSPDACGPQVEVYKLTEICRNTEDVRVENPNDSDQYVIVQRIKQIYFEDSQGRYFSFNLNPPAGA